MTWLDRKAKRGRMAAMIMAGSSITFVAKVMECSTRQVRLACKEAGVRIKLGKLAR